LFIDWDKVGPPTSNPNDQPAADSDRAEKMAAEVRGRHR
jgi:hypothetical protein